VRQTWPQTAQAHARQSGASVRVHDKSNGAVLKQCIRAAFVAQRDLPQSDRRISLRVGCRNLRRLSVRVSTAKANRASVLDTVRFVISAKTTRGDASRGGVSNYAFPGCRSAIQRRRLVPQMLVVMARVRRPLFQVPPDLASSITVCRPRNASRSNKLRGSSLPALRRGETNPSGGFRDLSTERSLP
jgi:hypothetical protein